MNRVSALEGLTRCLRLGRFVSVELMDTLLGGLAGLGLHWLIACLCHRTVSGSIDSLGAENRMLKEESTDPSYRKRPAGKTQAGGDRTD